MCMSILLVRRYVHLMGAPHGCSAHRNRKTVSESLELESLTVVSWCVDARTPTRVLFKNNKYSQPLSCPSRP